MSLTRVALIVTLYRLNPSRKFRMCIYLYGATFITANIGHTIVLVASKGVLHESRMPGPQWRGTSIY